MNGTDFVDIYPTLDKVCEVFADLLPSDLEGRDDLILEFSEDITLIDALKALVDFAYQAGREDEREDHEYADSKCSPEELGWMRRLRTRFDVQAVRCDDDFVTVTIPQSEFHELMREVIH